MPAREDGRTPEREEGRGTPLLSERLGGRGNMSDCSNILSILEAERRPLEEEGGRPRTVGRVTLIEGE